MVRIPIDDPLLPGLPADWRPTLLRLFLHLPFQPELAHDALLRLLAMDPDFRPGRWHTIPRVLMHLPWPASRYEPFLAPLWPQPLPPTPRPVPPSEPLSIFDYPCPPPESTPAYHLLARQSQWPDPWLASHARKTVTLLARSTSSASHIALSLARQHSYDLVAVRNQLLLAPLFAPWEGRLSEPPFDVDGPAYAITQMRPEEILSLPRVKLYLRHWLRPLPEGFGAFQGEAGWHLRQLALNHPSPETVIPFSQGRR